MLSAFVVAGTGAVDALLLADSEGVAVDSAGGVSDVAVGVGAVAQAPSKSVRPRHRAVVQWWARPGVATARAVPCGVKAFIKIRFSSGEVRQRW